mmetsp:Transcript_34809/g.81273  ORF Transcript_34809/g.81273 Transcript_34809/m.81273 type:complete len:90 (-) Transcript_34809:288-557(-)
MVRKRAKRKARGPQSRRKQPGRAEVTEVATARETDARTRKLPAAGDISRQAEVALDTAAASVAPADSVTGGGERTGTHCEEVLGEMKRR